MHELRQLDSQTDVSTVSFAQKMILSGNFKVLFSDGMLLVEDTASYLDGKGREEARELSRTAALAYASESMRLTTRLMQMTSWLLLQRAVNEGELTQEEAIQEHRKVTLKVQDVVQSNEMIDLLPIALQQLIERSVRMQSRIVKLDEVLSGRQSEGQGGNNPVQDQIDALEDAMLLGRRLG